MSETRFWLIRHAAVEEAARLYLYGIMDVALCRDDGGAGGGLPGPGRAAAAAGALAGDSARPHGADRRGDLPGRLPAQPLVEEPGLIEQDLGEWQGLPHADLPARLAEPAHAFWPLAATERPPDGESMEEVVVRVGATLERLAALWPGEDVVAVSHGGAIRAAVAHALGIGGEPTLCGSRSANLSLTRLERHAAGWRVVCVNEAAGL